MGPRRIRELTRAGAGPGLAVLAALLVTACGANMSTADASDAPRAPSSAGPPGAPANGDGGSPQAPPGPPAPASEAPPPPSDGTYPPRDSVDTSGWARDASGNPVAPVGW